MRRSLKQTPSALPDEALKALWCVLDTDDSDQLEVNEFAAFSKMGVVVKRASAKTGGEGTFASGGTFGKLITAGAALASQPTKEMRKELLEAGEALPDDDEMKSLSKSFNVALERLKKADGSKGQGALTWHSLFKAIDKDGSGFVTYDEIVEMTRRKLKQSVSELPEARLKALWCVLDADDSDQLEVSEFRKFAELGAAARSAPPPAFGGKGGAVRGTFGFIAGDALACQPTKEMRSEVTQAGVAIPDHEALNALAKTFSEGLEAAQKMGSKQASVSW